MSENVYKTHYICNYRTTREKSILFINFHKNAMVTSNILFTGVYLITTFFNSCNYVLCTRTYLF